MIPQATLLYGGLLSVLAAGLAVNVSRLRGRHKSFLGDEMPLPVIRANRAHGNLVESAPIVLLLLLAVELAGARSTVTHGFGGAYLAFRLLHAGGALSVKPPLTIVGSFGTVLVLVSLGSYALVLALSN